MSERRPKIPVKIQIDIAIRDGGYCRLCNFLIEPGEPIILEHLVPRAMFKNRADADKPENLAWVHKHCADLKTRGCTGTSKKGSVADGDTHKIAKAKRMEKERLSDVVALTASGPVAPFRNVIIYGGGEKPKWLMRGGKVIKSQGFRKDPNRVRGVDGKVRARKPKRT